MAVTLFDYDDDQTHKHQALRELALVARAYLNGQGRIDSRKWFLRKGTSRLTLEVDGRQWKLGKHASVVPSP